MENETFEKITITDGTVIFWVKKDIRGEVVVPVRNHTGQYAVSSVCNPSLEGLNGTYLITRICKYFGISYVTFELGELPFENAVFVYLEPIRLGHG